MIGSAPPMPPNLRQGRCLASGWRESKPISIARDLPSRPGGRYVLVNTATATLHLIEGNRGAATMRVVIGKAARREQRSLPLSGSKRGLRAALPVQP